MVVHACGAWGGGTQRETNVYVLLALLDYNTVMFTHGFQSHGPPPPHEVFKEDLGGGNSIPGLPCCMCVCGGGFFSGQLTTGRCSRMIMVEKRNQ